jgi:hypothetical protein
MLTAYNAATNSYEPMLYGTDLGAASGQIERMQQALLAVSKTGLTLANPGAITGELNKQTVLALLSVLLRLDLDAAWKAQIASLALQAVEVLGSEVIDMVGGGGFFGVGDDAYATLLSAVEVAAPTLTTAITNLALKRSGQTAGPTSPASDSLRDRMRSRLPTMTQQKYTPPEHVPGTVGPGARGFVSDTAGMGKTGTYALIGVGVALLGAGAWWLLR